MIQMLKKPKMLRQNGKMILAISHALEPFLPRLMTLRTLVSLG